MDLIALNVESWEMVKHVFFITAQNTSRLGPRVVVMSHIQPFGSGWDN